ncbi:MAG: GldG family protein [Deltaproteobacteria bacterium]|nr:GldG family protein [Deltaproteobacteria bacterium]
MALDDRRNTGGNRIIIGLNVGLSLVLAAALLVMVNWISSREYYRGDWTSGSIYSMSKKAEKIIKGLKKNVKITVFLSQDDPAFDGVKELLARMAQASKRVSVEYLDQDRNRTRAKELLQKFKIYDLNAVVFECESRSHYVTSDQMVDYDMESASSRPRFRGFKAEQAFVSAILDVSQEKQVKVCFLQGFGERDSESIEPEGMGNSVEELKRANYKVQELDRAGALKSKGRSCDVLVAAGPVKPYNKQMEAMFGNYLSAGGRLLLLLDPVPDRDQTAIEKTGLEKMLSELGVEVKEGVVVDPDKATLLDPGTSFFVDTYGKAQAVKPLADRKIPVVLSQARAFGLADVPGGIKSKRLMDSSTSAWLEKDIAQEGMPKPGKGEEKGPLLLGLTLEGKMFQGNKTKKADSDIRVNGQKQGTKRSGDARVAIVGDSDFAANWAVSNGGNLDLFLGLVHWLAEKGTEIEIQPKSPEQVHLALSDSQMMSLFWTVVVFMPIACVFLGVGVYLRRRR